MVFPFTFLTLYFARRLVSMDVWRFTIDAICFGVSIALFRYMTDCVRTSEWNWRFRECVSVSTGDHFTEFIQSRFSVNHNNYFIIQHASSKNYSIFFFFFTGIRGRAWAREGRSGGKKKVLTRNCIHEYISSKRGSKRWKTITIAARNQFIVESVV